MIYMDDTFNEVLKRHSVLGEPGVVVGELKNPWKIDTSIIDGVERVYKGYLERQYGRAYFHINVVCSDSQELLPDKILKTVSKLKGELMIKIAPHTLVSSKCIITKDVKDSLVKASKRLGMYGLKKPTIARFDEYCRRLPDELVINSIEGMTIEIIDSDIHGKYYMELQGHVNPNFKQFATDTPISKDDVTTTIKEFKSLHF